MKKNIIKLIVVVAVFVIGYKVVNYIYRQGFYKAIDEYGKLEELSRITPTSYVEKNNQETIEDDLVPQCSYGDCPEYKTFDVDEDGKSETIVSERIAMTQQAGQIWIIDDGKVVFKSIGEMQIGVYPRNENPDEQTNGFIISYATETQLSPNFKDSFKRDYYLFKDGKYILEKTDKNSFN